MKIEDGSAAYRVDAEDMKAIAPQAIATQTRYTLKRLIAVSWLLMSSHNIGA
jgi:hypothetical protein